ncbi:MAG: PucR family transcriptional regulator [Solirubrobacteraceae bacterium]
MGTTYAGDGRASTARNNDFAVWICHYVTMASRPWSVERVPRETVQAVRRAAGPLIDGIVAAIREENPVYADVLGGPEGLGIRLGIEQAIRSFLDAIERGQRPAGDTAELWRRLGEGEFQAGRSLDSLRAAFRTGTRAAWRGAADIAARAGLPTTVVIALAEAVFVYSDELATDVVEGFLRMQSDEAGERERRRRRLVTLLLDGEEHDPEALARAAELARWAVPRSLAVVALEIDSPGKVTRRLDVDVLVGADGDGAFLVLGDPDGPGRIAALRSAVGAVPAALGLTVSAREADRSLRWARAALRLIPCVPPAPASLIVVADHLATLIVLQDQALAWELAQRRLAPLLALSRAERDRLLETLGAWLAHQRHTPGIAAELHVHPQTVRYRMGKLRELLGNALDTPQGRFELELAVRVAGSLGSESR